MIEVNQIIKNLIPTEPVTIIKLQPLGNMYSIKYTGVNTHKTSTKVISKAQFESLEVLTAEGEFNFEYFVGSESSDVSDGVDRGAKGGIFTEL